MFESIRGHPFSVNCIVCCFLCLALSCSCVSCAKSLLDRKQRPETTWTCDSKADEALGKGDYESGILLHRRLLENEPNNGLALYHLGYGYGQLGNHLEEVLYYDKAIAVGFDREDAMFFNLGMALAELDRMKESIHALKRALDLNPDSADSHFGLATAYRMNLDWGLAAEEFRQAIEIDPKHLDARLYLSAVYTDMGRLEEAREQLRQILEIDPVNEAARDFLKSIEKE